MVSGNLDCCNSFPSSLGKCLGHTVNKFQCSFVTSLLTVYHGCRAVFLFWCVSEGELCNNSSGKSVLSPHPQLLHCDHQSTGQQDNHICAVWLAAASQPSTMLVPWYASPAVSDYRLLTCFLDPMAVLHQCYLDLGVGCTSQRCLAVSCYKQWVTKQAVTMGTLMLIIMTVMWEQP